MSPDPASTVSVTLPATLLAADLLMSWYKPLLVVAIFAPWAWVVSTIYDKDAARWYFKREAWNLGHMIAGIVALVAVLIAPLTFWIVWPVAAAILFTDLVVYFSVRNASDKVGASAKWSLNLAKMAEANASKKAGKQRKDRNISMDFNGPGGKAPLPEKDTPEYDVRLAVDELLAGLIDARGVQLDIAPSKDGNYLAVYMVDGIRQQAGAFNQQQAVAMIDMIKGVAGLDIKDRRRKLSADINVGTAGNTNTKARVTTLGSSAGVHMSFLLDPEGQVQRGIDELGLHDDPPGKSQMDAINALLDDAGGAVLLAAPPDHGRTQTMYALLRKHDAYIQNVQTLELSPQAALEGVRQNVFDPTGDAEYSTSLRSIIRRDPQVVGVAELPDDDSAKEVAKADKDRTRVYVSVRAESALPAIDAYVKQVGDPKAAAKNLKGVIAQRLVRRLCTNCRTAFPPTPEMLKKLGLPADTQQLYRKSGRVMVKDKEETCPVCNGAGFFGQVGIFEVHVIDDEARDAIAARDWSRLKSLFRQRGEDSLQQAGLRHVRDGNTAIEEIARVISPSKSKQAKSGSDAAA